MDIRDETPADFASIRAVHVEAFPTPAEADLVSACGKRNARSFPCLPLSKARLLGTRCFRKCSRRPIRPIRLGPVAVTTPYRRRGIAAALIQEGLERAKGAGWAKVFVLGDPAYYGRFGFEARAAAAYTSRYSGPHLMGLDLQPDASSASGTVEYAPPFSALH